jgi:hypothetical protein
MTADPYIGLGLGAATFSHLDSQFAFLVTLGANVPLGGGTYIGARYRGTFISGPLKSADNVLDTAIEFGGITIHTFSLILGFTLSTSVPGVGTGR